MGSIVTVLVTGNRQEAILVIVGCVKPHNLTNNRLPLPDAPPQQAIPNIENGEGK
ncbi:hypothetical protein PN471_03680 [Aphanizomenon sp. CS-733/32]|uniref:hypothetical protein n=1 Tax=Aphanizomenon sp. CS-733/32 TaxID=3021715 RepID=UPI0023302821|nr:hypothetical protein [Aphanizomenon sp. CS-733/32]MDB9307760.1 hypothetical protein [Aphanizomenon sp. CS-733/32]